MSSSQLETVLLVPWSDDVDDPGGILLLVQTLKNQVVALWSLIVDQVVSSVLEPDLH